MELVEKSDPSLQDEHLSCVRDIDDKDGAVNSSFVCEELLSNRSQVQEYCADCHGSEDMMESFCQDQQSNVNSCLTEICLTAEEKDEEMSSDTETMIGQRTLYYCKKCGISCLSLERIQQHVRQKSCVKTNQYLDQIHGNPSNYVLDHSYANELQCGGDGCGNVVNKSVKRKKATLAEAQIGPLPEEQYRCAVCPYVKLYSQTELDIHDQCHRASRFETLFACHMCHSNKGTGQRGRPLGLTADWQRVRMHLAKVHQVDFQLTCPTCGYMCASHTHLDKHHSQQHQVECESCSYRAKCASDLSVHVQCHVGPDLFQCYLQQSCGYEQQCDWDTMQAHLVEVHRGSIIAEFECQRCGKGFQQLAKYNQHCKTCMTRTVCERCRQSVLISKLQHHVAEQCGRDPEERSEPDPDGKAPGQCVMPPASTGDAGEAREDVPSGEASLRCNRHGVEFCSSREMEIHYQTEHGRSHLKKKKYNDFLTEDDLIKVTSRPGRVDAEPGAEGEAATGFQGADDSGARDESSERQPRPAGRLTAGRSAAVDEVGTSSTARRGRGRARSAAVDAASRVRCRYCYKLFADGWRLEAHCRRVHTEERLRRVPCAFCGKLFRNQVQRRNHVRQVHEGVKRVQRRPPGRPTVYFRCELCQFGTPDRGRLRCHVLAVHRGILPFACEYCDYKTKEKSDLRRHRLRHLGVKRHRCPYCSYQCLERWVMVNHCRCQHGVQLPRISRQTRGGPFSLHRLRRETADASGSGDGSPRAPVFSDVGQTERKAPAVDVDSLAHGGPDIAEVIVQTDVQDTTSNQVICIEQSQNGEILQYVLIPCDSNTAESTT